MWEHTNAYQTGLVQADSKMINCSRMTAKSILKSKSYSISAQGWRHCKTRCTSCWKPTNLNVLRLALAWEGLCTDYFSLFNNKCTMMGLTITNSKTGWIKKGPSHQESPQQCTVWCGKWKRLPWTMGTVYDLGSTWPKETSHALYPSWPCSVHCILWDFTVMQLLFVSSCCCCCTHYRCCQVL
jgi:hypothetical protein